MAERILILDDEPDFASFAEAALASVGHEVRVITDSVKTPTVIEEFDPTVFLLDIVMPGLDGIEIVDWLAKSRFRGRVILISGYGANYISVTSKIAKVKGLDLAQTLHKPITPEKLRKAVAGEKPGSARGRAGPG